MIKEPHDSDSRVQLETEAIALAALSEQLDVELRQGVSIKLEQATVKPDGASDDESVLVEVSAHIGPLKGSQKHKVSTDALKMVALRETRPKARLILAFVDKAAADAVVGWRAAVLERYGVEKLVVQLSPAQRQAVLESQARQKRGMSGG